MSALPPLPLLTFRPDWEPRWDEAHARYEELKPIVNGAAFRFMPQSQRARVTEAFEEAARAMRRLFVAQFRTTDEYCAWCLEWLDIRLRFKPEGGFSMVSGLPVAEIRRRVEAAEAFRLFGSSIVRAPDREAEVQALFMAPPNAAVSTLAYALARVGGDRV